MNKVVWNKNAVWARDCKDHPEVRSTSYGEVFEILGTAGCSREEPFWSWMVLGVLETERGKQLVCPGDSIIEIVEGVYLVTSDTDLAVKIVNRTQPQYPIIGTINLYLNPHSFSDDRLGRLLKFKPTKDGPKLPMSTTKYKATPQNTEKYGNVELTFISNHEIFDLNTWDGFNDVSQVTEFLSNGTSERQVYLFFKEFLRLICT
jgi:hypothetical protein